MFLGGLLLFLLLEAPLAGAWIEIRLSCERNQEMEKKPLSQGRELK